MARRSLCRVRVASINDDDSATRRAARALAGWLASVLQAASKIIVVKCTAARSHACLAVRLALTSSGTNQYRRVAATGGGKDALITAVEQHCVAVQQQQLHSDAGICRSAGSRYGPAAAALQACPEAANAPPSRYSTGNAHMQLPLLRRRISEQKRSVPTPARVRRLLRCRSSRGPARSRGDSRAEAARRDVSCWLWCWARCRCRGSAHIAL